MLTGGQIAIIVVTVFWAMLVCFIAVVLWRLARLIEETTRMVADLGTRAEPLLEDLTRTVRQAGEQLGRMEPVTKQVAGVSQNVSAATGMATGVMTSVVGGPLVKAAAFTYGVRKALGNTLDSGGQSRPASPATPKRTNRKAP